jgi:aminoglycoside 6-adenylyltransferase
MSDLILSYAQQDERIRVVVLNGSRVNPNMPADIFQDYDVVYFVDDLSPYLRSQSVIDYFGETIIVQLPDELGDPGSRRESRYAYLMQFADGNRIDLTFCLLEELERVLGEDSLTKVLLDKDNCCGELPPPTDQGYFPVPPTRDQFDHCCNEFWWLMPYVAKGLWRGEVIGPKYFQDVLIQGELQKMLTWYYGVQTKFEKSPGKLGRFLDEVIGHDLWGMLKLTYSDANAGNVWNSLYTMGEIFRSTAQDVALHLGYSYPIQDDARVTEFLRLVQSLPQDASSFDP